MWGLDFYGDYYYFTFLIKNGFLNALKIVLYGTAENIKYMRNV